VLKETEISAALLEELYCYRFNSSLNV